MQKKLPRKLKHYFLCFNIIGILFVNCAHQTESTLNNPPMTNWDLFETALYSVLADEFINLPIENTPERIRITPKIDHEANELVEHVLFDYFSQRSPSIILNSNSDLETTALFQYHGVTLQVAYQSPKSWWPFSTDSLIRTISVAVHAKLVDQDGNLQFSVTLKNNFSDRIPRQIIADVEDDRYEFTQSDYIVDEGWLYHLEPALVTTLIGSLIYLFNNSRKK